MQTILTKRLLGFLIKKGYKYCLAYTIVIDQSDAMIGITLKPVRKRPLLQKLPCPYQNYFELLKEPFQMASGLPDTKILVELTKTDFQNYSLN